MSELKYQLLCVLAFLLGHAAPPDRYINGKCWVCCQYKRVRVTDPNDGEAYCATCVR